MPTLLIPISVQALNTLMAISPLLATSTLFMGLICPSWLLFDSLVEKYDVISGVERPVVGLLIKRDLDKAGDTMGTIVRLWMIELV